MKNLRVNHYLRMRVNYRFIAAILLFFSVGTFAQTDSILDVKQNRSKPIVVRDIDTSDFVSYRDLSKYRYTTKPKENESFIDAIKRWFYDKFLRKLFEGTANYALNVLFYTLAVAGAIALFYYVFQVRGRSSLARDEIQWGDVYKNPVEIEEEFFVQSMTDAETSSDYNRALKYLYFWTIRQLDEKNIIKYRSDYTNSRVRSMIKDEEVGNLFQDVSTSFEYVWYGQFDIDETQYHDLKTRLFQSKLKT